MPSFRLSFTGGPIIRAGNDRVDSILSGLTYV